MIREHNNVVLTRNIEEHGLARGDVGVAVHCYPDETAFEVEFMTKDGHTTAVLTLTKEDIRPMNQSEKTIHLLDVQMNEVDHIVSQAENDNDFDTAKERLDRWKTRTIKYISENIDPTEGEKLEQRRRSSSLIGQPLANLKSEADMYRAFVQALREEVREHPNVLLSAPVTTRNVNSPVVINQRVDSESVFIVHGHDETNMLRLQKLIRDRWELEAIILKFEPGKGRTLIEKFEEEATRARYAMVLMTPDDLIETVDGGYTQARPNVVLELGWFYGRIGRQNVCILSKSGTKLHSDLDGINRVDFNDSVEEAVLGIEAELNSAGLI